MSHSSFSSKYSQRHESQTVRARELTFCILIVCILPTATICSKLFILILCFLKTGSIYNTTIYWISVDWVQLKSIVKLTSKFLQHCIQLESTVKKLGFFNCKQPQSIIFFFSIYILCVLCTASIYGKTTIIIKCLQSTGYSYNIQYISAVSVSSVCSKNIQ